MPIHASSSPCLNRLCSWTGFLGIGLAWLMGTGAAHGQADSPQSIAQRLASYNQRVPTEKLFMHLDRPAYLTGETLWFKLYAVEGNTHQLLPASKVAYVEVLNSENAPVLQTKIGLVQATGRGSLVLPHTLTSGRYTVRAYTSWMQNGAPDRYFHTTVSVVNTHTQSSLPAARAVTTYDAQFFPEGGSLVQGLQSKVGFKITDAAGRGVAATGTVLDQSGATVAQFRTLRFGLGSFSFAPAKAGETYRAVIKPANQAPITVNLPAVQEQGYVLRLEDAGPSQLRVVVQAAGAALASERIFLLGHAGQRVNVATEAQLYEGKAAFMVDKQKLAEGLSHLTIFNSRRQPLCERLYFRPPVQQLRLGAKTDKPQYSTREKVSLQLAASSPANLSVAVYQLDSLSATSGAGIASYLWLTSDLKGAVEHPEYYVTATGPEAAEATDNLLLTQGWSRFTWADVLADQPAPLPYLPELNGHLVRGRVVHSGTGAPAANMPVFLTAPGRQFLFHSSMSKADGSLQFEVPGLYGLKQLIVQPDIRRDSLTRVDLLSPFSSRFASGQPAALWLPETWAPSLQRRHVQSEVQQHYFGKPATYRVPKADTLAFYGKPNERYFLDQFTRFKVMEEVMREYVPGVLVRIRKDGFHFLVPDANARNLFENPLVLLDGMPVFNINKIMAIDPLKIQKLDVVTARFFQGPLVYDGVVSYTTYKGDLAGFPLDPRALLQEYEGLQGQREFYAPRYDTPQASQSPAPDFRGLLYWNPDATAGALPDFFTSDQTGKYRVVVQGLAPNGQAASTSFDFEVKQAL